jgi:hypothetical protein
MGAFDFLTGVEGLFAPRAAVSHTPETTPPADHQFHGEGQGAVSDIMNALGHYTDPMSAAASTSASVHTMQRGVGRTLQTGGGSALDTAKDNQREIEWEMARTSEDPDNATARKGAETTASQAERVARARYEEWEKGPGSSATDNQKAGARIGARYDSRSNILGRKPVDLSSPEARDRALNQMTQNAGRDGDATGESRCGAASIVGGMLKAEGGKGVSTLIDTIERMDSDPNMSAKDKKAELKMLEDIKKRAGTNKLNFEDLSNLQEKLYGRMRHEMVERNAAWNAQHPNQKPRETKNPGLDELEMREFLHRGEINEVFDKNDMGIDYIDNNGSGMAHHYVLEMRKQGKPSSVYDPYYRRGGQLVTERRHVDDYTAATETHINPNKH